MIFYVPKCLKISTKNRQSKNPIPLLFQALVISNFATSQLGGGQASGQMRSSFSHPNPLLTVKISGIIGHQFCRIFKIIK